MKLENMRIELIEYLKDLSNKEYQEKCWINGDCPQGVVYDCLDYSIHFLYDDTSLSSDPESWIGYVLKNKEEACLILKLCKEIDFIFDKYGTNLSDIDYINLSEWDNVINAAAEAYSVLTRK